MQLTQAILPVAGLGTRFLPWTKVVPKELLPLGSKPIIAHIVDECLDAGITDICFVISRGKELIPQYFYQDATLERALEKRGKLHLLEELRRYDNVRIHVTLQEEQLGDGHAILQAKEWVESPMVAVLFGDDLITGAASGLAQLQRAYDALVDTEEAAVIALQRIAREATRSYGVAAIERACSEHEGLFKLSGLVEKPDPADAPSDLGIIGRYLIPRSTFDVLPTLTTGSGEIRLIDALIEQLRRIPVFGQLCEGTRIDTGTPEGYREAVRTLG